MFEIPSDAKLVILSCAFSVSGVVIRPDELQKLVHSSLPPNCTLYLDCAQAFGNVDLSYLRDFLQISKNPVAVVGSLIKALRGGDGGCGFLLTNRAFRTQYPK